MLSCGASINFQDRSGASSATLVVSLHWGDIDFLILMSGEAARYRVMRCAPVGPPLSRDGLFDRVDKSLPIGEFLLLGKQGGAESELLQGDRQVREKRPERIFPCI